MTKERLEELKEALRISRKLITMDIYYCIYDTDCVVQYMYPEDGNKDGIYVGSVFHDPTGKLDETLATERHIHNFLPMERFGFCMEGNLIPVYDKGELCGAISTAYIPMNQQQLAARELAVQSVYYLIMSVNMKNTHCTRLYFNIETRQFPMDAQHFDDFCEKSLCDVHPDDREMFLRFTELSGVWERLQKQKTIAMECRLRDIMGEYRWTELIFSRIEEFDGKGSHDTAVYMVRDIHERKSKEIEILQKNEELIRQLELNNGRLFEQGVTDELTKLYNRKGLVWFGTKMLEQAQRKGHYIYVLMADLNGLKYINDKFGHEEGDKAIRMIAGLLKGIMPEYAIVSRTGGDEFTIMAELEEGSQVPWELDRKLLKCMQDFNHGSGLSYMVEASYGWDFRLAGEYESLDDCINRADKKMYIMKSRKKKSHSHFSDKAQGEIARRFGSAKHKVLILSQDKQTQEEIAGFFDESYLVEKVEDAGEAVRKMTACDEIMMCFVDSRLAGQTGLSFIRGLSGELRKKTVAVLLLQEEEPGAVKEAFDMNVDDVLVRPYGTALNRYHMTRLFRMDIENRRLGRMLDLRQT